MTDDQHHACDQADGFAPEPLDDKTAPPHVMTITATDRGGPPRYYVDSVEVTEAEFDNTLSLLGGRG